MLANGTSALILALFFAELGVPDTRIGLFMTLTILGDVALSLFLTLVADHTLGRRRTLLVGSVLMIFSGAAFALSENYCLLLLAAVVGVISATGGDFGPFRAIEESMLASLTTAETRADVLAWYVTSASLGAALGSEISGRIVEILRERDGWTLADAYHACFWLYTAMGTVNLLLSLLLTRNCELGQEDDAKGVTAAANPDEAEPLLVPQDNSSQAADNSPAANTSGKTLFAQISRETLSIMATMWILLMIDTFADGMVSMTLTMYYMDRKFHLAKSWLGDVLTSAYILAGFSTVFSGPLSRYIGLVNTMVFTHVPSSLAVLFFPLPSAASLAVTLLLVRVGLNNMDQPPRSALIAAIVRPDERTAVNGITSTLRALASTIGPYATGVLAGGGKFWIAFVVAGSLRLVYDVGVFVMFINVNLHRHESSKVGQAARGNSSGADAMNEDQLSNTQTRLNQEDDTARV
jgi:MFS family permease